MFESAFSPAAWVLVEESICTVPKGGTKTLQLVITLHFASVCRPGKQDLTSTIRSFRFALLYGRGKNHFLHRFCHFVFLRRTGVFIIIITIIIIII